MKDWEYRPATDIDLTPFARAKSLRRESGLVATLGHAAWWASVRAFLAVYHRVELHGKKNIPSQPPFILVANHSSHLDSLVLASAVSVRWCDRVFPIAAADVFFSRAHRTIFAAMLLNALPMYRTSRGRHALAELRWRLINEPCIYLLFPEGARSRDGQMLPIRGGIGMMVAGTNVPVVPCWLEGCFEALCPGQFIPRPRKLAAYFGAPMRFDQVANDREGWEQVARTIESGIRSARLAGTPSDTHHR